MNKPTANHVVRVSARNVGTAIRVKGGIDSLDISGSKFTDCHKDVEIDRVGTLIAENCDFGGKSEAPPQAIHSRKSRVRSSTKGWTPGYDVSFLRKQKADKKG